MPFLSPLSNEARQLLHSINSHASHCYESLVSPCLKAAGKNPGGEEKDGNRGASIVQVLNAFPTLPSVFLPDGIILAFPISCFTLDLSVPQESLPHSPKGQSLLMKRQNENKALGFSPLHLAHDAGSAGESVMRHNLSPSPSFPLPNAYYSGTA